MKKNILGWFLLLTTLLLFFLFPFMGKWIKSSEITVQNSPKQPWFLENENTKYALVYFGYVGCSTICTPSLNEIKELYKTIDKEKIELPFYFVNIDPKLPSNLPDIFVKGFDKRFHGIYTNYEELNKLKQDFNLNIKESEIEITHSSNLYLFKKNKEQYSLHKIYITHPFDEKLLIKALSN